MPDADVRTVARPRRRLASLVVAVAIAATSIACRDNDVVTSSYATMAESRADGATTRDIPPGVPEGAHDIRTARDLDSRRHWGLFNFAPEDADALRALLQADETSIDGIDCGIPGRIEWWPVLLRGNVSGEQAKAAGLHAYRSREGSRFFVVNWKQGRAYYWSGT